MTSSSTPPFDDADGPADNDALPHEEADRGASLEHDVDDARRSPNFFIRRAIVVGGVIAAVIGGGLFVKAIVDDSKNQTATDASVEWNTIALVDERTGDVILTDNTGTEEARFTLGVGSVIDSLAIDSTMMVTAADQVSVADLSAKTTETFEIAGADSGVVVPAGSNQTMLAASAANNQLVVAHGPTGDVLDSTTFDPIAGAQFDVSTSIASPSGRDVLVTDTGNFQSVLYSIDQDAPTFFTGRSLAIDDSVLVTTQNVGNEASVSVFDHDGASIATTRAPSVQAGMIVGANVLLVTVDGEIIELATSSGTTSSVGDVDIGTVQSGYVTPSADRLVVVGDAGSAIIDAEGAVLGEFKDAMPLSQADGQTHPTSTCAAFVRAADAAVLIVAFENASIVEEAVIDGSVLSSVDGCMVVGSSASGLTVVSSEGVQQLDADGDLVAVAPDGSAVVLDSKKRLVIVELDSVASGDVAAPVDLGPSTRLVAFANL